jgi:polysaccharide deacetylase family protein (PEP-CTERM system associated)
MISALTIDLEDAVNQAMRNYFKTTIEPTNRVYDNTMRLLDLLSKYNTKTTFFILGEVAHSYPKLIKEISNRNHELGIHGYSHTRYYSLSKEKVREEIVRAKHLVEDISGLRVIGHRAPEFSINKNTFWVMEILADAGFKYDSSIFPAKSVNYGWPSFKKDIDWVILNEHRKIIEAPLSSVNFLGIEIPVCGGSYIRIFPYSFTNYVFKKVLHQRPVNVYLHPYEIDPPPFQQFYMDAVSNSSFKIKTQIRAYWYNRESVMPKICNLLNTYKFDTLQNIIKMTLKIDL